MPRGIRRGPRPGGDRMTTAADATHRDNFLAAVASAACHDAGHGTGVEFHDVYLAAWAHQRQCSPAFLDLTGRPSRSCLSTDCLTRGYERTLPHSDYYAARAEFDVCRRWAWAVPNAAALTAIADAAPHGVVEIGAGGGYWAHELARVGVDVTAYDPHPPGDPQPSRWHNGHPWTEVHRGDHTAAAHHPDRTLLVCWPETDTQWPADAITAYHAAGGRSVIYVGEGPGGVTTDPGLSRLLGITPGDDTATDGVITRPNVYAPTRQVMIPQWAGVHDYLTVCARTDDEEAADP